MTKVSVFGDKPTEKKELKQIELVEFIKLTRNSEAVEFANEYENITLLVKDYCRDGFDLILAYDEDVNDGGVYFGYWNDGIV